MSQIETIRTLIHAAIPMAKKKYQGYICVQKKEYKSKILTFRCLTLTILTVNPFKWREEDTGTLMIQGLDSRFGFYQT